MGHWLRYFGMAVESALINMENRRSIQATYTVKPSLVAKRLGYKGKLTTEGAAITLAENEHSKFIFDPEQGSVKITLNFDTMNEAVLEVVERLKESKLPLVFENESLLSVQAWAFTSKEDVAIMESNGFEKEGNREWIWNGWNII